MLVSNLCSNLLCILNLLTYFQGLLPGSPWDQSARHAIRIRDQLIQRHHTASSDPSSISYLYSCLSRKGFSSFCAVSAPVPVPVSNPLWGHPLSTLVSVHAHTIRTVAILSAARQPRSHKSFRHRATGRMLIEFKKPACQHPSSPVELHSASWPVSDTWISEFLAV